MQADLSWLKIIHYLFGALINGGILLGFFVILLLNNKGVRKTRANIFLSILLASLTFSIFHLSYAGVVFNHFAVQAYSLGDPTFLLIAPLLLFYIMELTGSRVKFNMLTLAHFAPFAAIIFFSIAFRSSLSDSAPRHFLDEHPRMPLAIFWFILVAQFSIYLYIVHRKWRDYQQIIRQEVSNPEDVSISWVQFFIAVFLIVNLSFLFSLFAVIHLDIMGFVWRFIGFILAASIFALGYKGILQKEVFFADVASQPTVIKKEDPAEPADQAMIGKLLEFMTTNKPYLNPELSLSSLSQELGINRNQLSQLINDGIGENFYDFVNKFRVDEVKRLMADPQKQNYNLLGIALEAGFKSKSTFNLVFKRFTGLTPTEYKKNIT